MDLSPESYYMIYGFIIAAIIMSIFIIICMKYHNMIMQFCKRNQVAPEPSSQVVNLPKPPELKIEIYKPNL